MRGKAPKIGDKVVLNECEQRIAKFLGAARHRGCRADELKNGRRNPKGDEATDLEGVAVELAGCRLLNLYPDLEIGVRPAYDAVLHDGRFVDFKGTTYKTGRLLALPGKEGDDIDLFALLVGEFPGPYEFRGVVSREEMFRPGRLIDLGRGPTYAVTQAELNELTPTEKP